MARSDRQPGQGRMPKEGETCPISMVVTQLRVIFRQYKFIPFVVHTPRGPFGVEGQKIPSGPGVPGQQA